MELWHLDGPDLRAGRGILSGSFDDGGPSPKGAAGSGRDPVGRPISRSVVRQPGRRQRRGPVLIDPRALPAAVETLGFQAPENPQHRPGPGYGGIPEGSTL